MAVFVLFLLMKRPLCFSWFIRLASSLFLSEMPECLLFSQRLFQIFLYYLLLVFYDWYFMYKSWVLKIVWGSLRDGLFIIIISIIIINICITPVHKNGITEWLQVWSLETMNSSYINGLYLVTDSKPLWTEDLSLKKWEKN